MTIPDNNFKFAISLSVLNHLGRNLYRSFITVLGEAISNSWDADAKNVWIEIDRNRSAFSIKDDGIGMNRDDFQEKLLKVGYSKRADGNTKTTGGRPYIGAKGIGKLALLSCAERVSIFSKTKGTAYVGGVIDNTELDEAIAHNTKPDGYPLGDLEYGLIESLRVGHDQGTIIVFEKTKDQIRNTLPRIKKLLAMSFRFSLIDEDFSIFVNGDEVTIADLKDLMNATEFLWLINSHTDEYVSGLKALKSEAIDLDSKLDIRGFIATVNKPGLLKISDTEERATIDLFVNGRLREKNILRHRPMRKIVQDYMYGQIHFDTMDQPGKDPFTSSRESILESDENFQSLLNHLKKDVFLKILDKWDELRVKRGEEGDEENSRKTPKERKALNLYTLVRKEYELENDAPGKDQVDTWMNDLGEESAYNIPAYVSCYLSENLVRKYIAKQGFSLEENLSDKVQKCVKKEAKDKKDAEINFEIRKDTNDLNYLGMDDLAKVAEGLGAENKQLSLWKDAIQYKPIRNVLCHTGLLEEKGKSSLNSTFKSISVRVKALLSQGSGRT